MIRNRQTTFLSMELVHIPSGDLCKEAQKLKPQKEFIGGCMPNIRLFNQNDDRTHSQMLGKFEYTRGPIFKVVLEC